MDPEYLPEQYLERLREANAAIIEFEQLIAAREEELRSAREEIEQLRQRLENARMQGELLELGQPHHGSEEAAADSPGVALTGVQAAELRSALRQIVDIAGELKHEAEQLLPPGILERLDEMIRRARAACEIL